MIYERVAQEKQRLEEQIQFLKERIQLLPRGKIYCSRSGKYVKWFLNDGDKQVYIPKSNRKLAEDLALKKYYFLQLKELEQEEKAIDFYIRHRDKTYGEKALAMIDSPEYKELLYPYFQPLSIELSEWQNATYQKNENYPEFLTHKTISGNYVRSKSEAIIASILYQHKIPYRYECCLQLGEVQSYPDFTIRHPKTGETYYWEHFGIMDDEKYSKRAFLKLQHYANYGIIPSIQLITTYEDKTHPISMEMVEGIVTHYFL